MNVRTKQETRLKYMRALRKSAARYAAGVKNPRRRTQARRFNIKRASAQWAGTARKAANRYALGFEPYRQALERIQLPPRGPMGDPANILRARIVCDTMRAVRAQLQGASKCTN